MHLSPKGSVGGKARAQKDVSGVLNHAHDPARKEKRCRGDPPDALRPTDTYLPPRTTNAEREEFTNGLRGVDRERSPPGSARWTSPPTIASSTNRASSEPDGREKPPADASPRRVRRRGGLAPTAVVDHHAVRPLGRRSGRGGGGGARCRPPASSAAARGGGAAAIRRRRPSRGPSIGSVWADCTGPPPSSAAAGIRRARHRCFRRSRRRRGPSRDLRSIRRCRRRCRSRGPRASR